MKNDYQSECVCIHKCMRIINAKCMGKPKEISIDVTEFVIKDSFFGDTPAIVIKCEDIFYPDYAGKYFILRKSNGYGFFKIDGLIQTFTKGEILDEFGINI